MGEGAADCGSGFRTLESMSAAETAGAHVETAVGGRMEVVESVGVAVRTVNAVVVELVAGD